MKTSELRKWLDENDCQYEENDVVIYGAFWKIWKKEQRLIVTGFVPLDIIKVLAEYHNTPLPLNEREDEKKYIIKTSIGTISHFNVYLNTEQNKFILLPIEEKFTQQEIDDFPKEIKGAIECGFLRKVEVE